jgi:predicted O-methyltransferase YrrM
VVLAEIRRRRPRATVELGCGASTLELARELRRQGGALVSLEHDRAWAERVRTVLAENELGGLCRVLEAPLEPCSSSLDEAAWYAQWAVEELPQRIELLLIDGPPGNEAGIERSRYPALPELGPHLAPGALVVLDDAGRPGEREIVGLWEDRHPVSFEPAAGGRLAVGIYG